MKTLIYWRHSVKGSGDHKNDIMQEGLDATSRAIEVAIGKDVALIAQTTHFFAGPLKRTWQTLVPVLVHFVNNEVWDPKGAKIHEEIHEIGATDLFKMWTDGGVKFGGPRTNFRACLEDMHQINFQKAQDDAVIGVKKMMVLMSDGEAGLAVGHSPIIELAADATGLHMTNAPQLKENEYIIFEQDEAGIITARYPS